MLQAKQKEMHQCDQILRNFAGLIKFSKFWAIFDGFNPSLSNYIFKIATS